MRDCIFLLADRNMQAAFEGFLARGAFQQRLGCCTFDFDIIVAAGDNDPGLYTRGHELLRPFQTSHRHAVVVLDAEWDGSPGRESIVEHLSRQISATGWDDDTFQVIVIEPELENWIWQKNDHVARGLGFDNRSTLMDDLDLKRAWPDSHAKPSSPKEVLELLLRKQRIPRSSAIYKNIFARRFLPSVVRTLLFKNY